MDRDRLIRFGVLQFGVFHLVIGLWQVVAPHAFFDTIGGFGTYNRHYMGDNATYELALGLALLVSLRRPAWRVPLLALTALQIVLHAINHLVDIGSSHPAWAGVFDFVSLALAAVVAVGLAVMAGRERAPA
jgi:hypothetical protein